MSGRRPFDTALLRLVVITDGRGDLERIESVVAAAIAGGARCVQLREPSWTARQLGRACERLVPVLTDAGGWLLVNDRLDVAAACGAHGAQIGAKSLPPDAARSLLGDAAVIGYSAHDRSELDLAAAGGCDFALLSPVWPTRSKPVAPLGEVTAALLTAAARLPVVWLGGVDAAKAARSAALRGRERPAGLAAMSAVMGAPDPAEVARSLLRAFAGLGELPSASG